MINYDQIIRGITTAAFDLGVFGLIAAVALVIFYWLFAKPYLNELRDQTAAQESAANSLLTIATVYKKIEKELTHDENKNEI